MRDTLLPPTGVAIHWRQDLRSKFIDGLLAAVVLVLLLSMMVLLVRPIQILAGRPGLLIYTISLMAVSVYCLEHALITRYPDTTRAWYGMTGGLVAWVAVSLSNDLGSNGSTSITSLLLLLLIALIVTRLWRRHLPQGMHFYSLSLLLAWSGEILILGKPDLLERYPISDIFFNVLAVLFLLACFLTLWWTFTQTGKRMQRLSAAPWLAFFGIVAVFLLR